MISQTYFNTGQHGFTDRELRAMHRYALKYRDLVRSGGTPTEEQTRNFLAFQKVTYATGVAYE